MKLYKSGVSKYKSAIYRTFISSKMQVKIDCKRNLMIYGNFPIIFIHVPKVAGTSISHRLYGKSILHVRAKDFKNNYPDIFSARFSFGLVREPFERLYSAYRFVLNGGTKTVPVCYKKEYTYPEFSSFERFVEEWLPNQSYSTLDHVFHFQSDFLCDDGEVVVDHVGTMRKLSDTIRVINEVSDNIIIMPDKVNVGIESESWEKMYTPSMKSIVKSIYLDDFNLYQKIL